jgi:hypothetical protein
MSNEASKSRGGSKPKWIYARDGVQRGPVTSKDLQALATRGELLPTDVIWKEGMKDWVRADLSSLVFPDSAEATVVTDTQVQEDFLPVVSINVDGNLSQTSAPPSSSPQGLRGLVAVAREAWNEAKAEEEQKLLQNQDAMIEALSYFEETLGRILASDEVVHFQLEGLDISGLVCTDKRIIIFHTGAFSWMLGNVKTFHASYDEITGVSLIEEKLRIQPLLGGGYVFEIVTPDAQAGATAAGSFFEFAAEPNRLAFCKDKLPKLRKAESFIRERMEAVPKPVEMQSHCDADLSAEREPTTRSEPSAASVVERLKTLADLKAQGLLTEEEFATQKKKVLEQI